MSVRLVLETAESGKLTFDSATRSRNFAARQRSYRGRQQNEAATGPRCTPHVDRTPYNAPDPVARRGVAERSIFDALVTDPN